MPAFQTSIDRILSLCIVEWKFNRPFGIPKLLEISNDFPQLIKLEYASPFVKQPERLKVRNASRQRSKLTAGLQQDIFGVQAGYESQMLYGYSLWPCIASHHLCCRKNHIVAAVCRLLCQPMIM
jgi:hypothetical protein